MKNIKDYIRKDLKDFKPYHDPHKPFKVKLNANESPFSLAGDAKKAFIEWIENSENLNLYPDTDSTELRAELAKFWGVSKENIICGVGSDQVIDFITKVFLESGDKVVVPSPTFSMYKLTTEINHGKIVEVPLNESFCIDVEHLINVTNEQNAKLLFVCTPNNPTGNSLEVKDILRILNNVKCPVVVDEAYTDFSDTTVISEINNYRNLIVLRTFSKAYSLAGVRLGYAVACEQMIETLNLTKPPYNLPTISQVLGISVLKCSNEYKRRIEYLNEQRNVFYNELSKIQWLNVYKSDANFIFAKSDKNVWDVLDKNGILIRKFKSDAGEEILRFTVGTKEQNEQVVKELLKCQEAQ